MNLSNQAVIELTDYIQNCLILEGRLGLIDILSNVQSGHVKKIKINKLVFNKDKSLKDSIILFLRYYDVEIVWNKPPGMV